MSSIQTRVLTGFDDRFGSTGWEQLLERAGTDIIYLTREWQRVWWEVWGEGDLLLIAAEKDNQVVAIAPFYAESGMVLFIGTGFESGYLDFIGDLSDPDVVDKILETAYKYTKGFLGFELAFVHAQSPTTQRLLEAARRLGFSCYNTETNCGATMNLTAHPDLALASTKKKDLVSHERHFRREGLLTVLHLNDGDQILNHLDAFFEQHIARWAVTPTPSAFLGQRSRLFLERLTRAMADTGWLRFTRIDWNGKPIAFQYGFCYRGRYFKEISTHALDMRRNSPGQVLLRQLLVAAIDEGVRIFDFGIGDQAYKRRFATQVDEVNTWQLCPSSSFERSGSPKQCVQRVYE